MYFSVKLYVHDGLAGISTPCGPHSRIRVKEQPPSGELLDAMIGGKRRRMNCTPGLKPSVWKWLTLVLPAFNGPKWDIRPNLTSKGLGKLYVFMSCLWKDGWVPHKFYSWKSNGWMDIYTYAINTNFNQQKHNVEIGSECVPNQNVFLSSVFYNSPLFSLLKTIHFTSSLYIQKVPDPT